MSIIDRIGALAGTELGKAIDLAHRHYQERMAVHNHTGRALVETAAEVARNHPNLIGIGVGLMVEQFLTHQKRQHDLMIASGGKPINPQAETQAPPPGSPDRNGDAHSKAPHKPVLPRDLIPHDLAHVAALRPGRVALEVFGGLLLLKLAATGARMFRHKHQSEVWFAPAARIRLFSGTLAAFYLMKSIRSPKLSAWRNGAVALFATDAMKPVLKVRKGDRPWLNTEAEPASPPPSALPAPPPPGPYTRPTFPSETPAGVADGAMAQDYLNGSTAAASAPPAPSTPPSTNPVDAPH